VRFQQLIALQANQQCFHLLSSLNSHSYRTPSPDGIYGRAPKTQKNKKSQKNLALWRTHSRCWRS
jgi:hypothetical protein